MRQALSEVAGEGTSPDAGTWPATEHCCHRGTSSTSTPATRNMTIQEHALISELNGQQPESGDPYGVWDIG